MDALAYANTTSLLDINDIQNLSINFPGGSSPVDQVKSYLDNTTIKRACCMGRTGPYNINGSTGVNVKIPIPTNYNVSSELNANTKNQFGYIEKTVYIPDSMCDAQWKKYQPYCDNFMNSYCHNQYKAFQEMSGDQTGDGSIWPAYLKECSCYAPPDPKFGSAPKNCYMYGCIGGDSDVYLSADSRDSTGSPLQCNLTICSSIVNASDISSGGNTSFNPTIKQQCGQQIDQAQQQAAAQAQSQAQSQSQAEALAKLQEASQAKAAADSAAAQATTEAEAVAAASQQAAANKEFQAATAEVQAATNPQSGSPSQESSGISSTTWIIIIGLLCLFLLSAVGGIVMWKRRQN